MGFREYKEKTDQDLNRKKREKFRECKLLQQKENKNLLSNMYIIIERIWFCGGNIVICG